MGPRTFRLLLMSMFTVLFMNERDRVLTRKWFRFCFQCDYFNGLRCRKPMKECWKFNILPTNRSCTTEHFYYYDRLASRQLYDYSVLSCKDCEEGVLLLHHDLLRETVCCMNDDKCNDGSSLPEKSKYGLEGRESIYDTEPVVYKQND